MLFEKLKEGKKKKKNGRGLAEVESPVTDALIMICEKCGKKLADDKDDNPARQLQKELKKESKDRYSKRTVRALLTGCMDICPKGAVAVAVAPVGPEKGQGTKFYEIDEADLETAVDELLATVRTSN